MPSNQSALEQMLQAALGGGGLREREGGGAGVPRAKPDAPGNIGDILGSLLGAAAGSGATTNIPGAAGSGGLGEILGSLLGGAAGGSGAGGAQPDSGAPAGNWMQTEPKDPASRQQQAEVAEGAGMNDLVRYGGMAVIGVLAYQALKRFQAQQGGGQKEAAAQVPPPDSGFHPSQARGGADALAGVLIKAMVAATQADGVIDEDEQQRLAGRLDQLGLSSADRRALVEQLTTPVDPREIVTAANSPEVGLQIYAASVLATTVDTPAERNYLDALANALNIDPRLKVQVEQTLGRG